MYRIFAAVLGLAFMATAAPSVACTVPQTYENQIAWWSETPEQIEAIIDRSEIIVDGVIARTTDGTPRLRITKVWKGDVGADVPVHLSTYGCETPPQIGTEVRFAGWLDAGWLLYRVLPPKNAVLDQKLREYELKKPMLEAERARQMQALQAKTKALELAAATGDLQARLALVSHLLRNGEQARAYEIAGALRREGVKLAIGQLLLNPEQMDWSDLKRIHNACYSDHGNFDAATFDRADLAECAFRYSSFRGASFRGTDLTGSYFQNSDLTGATYDCATKLPEDLDPVAAGMINVQGTCPRPVPQ